MTSLRQHPFFMYVAVLFFLASVAAAVWLQQWWWIVLPVILLFSAWAFEKPVLLFNLLVLSIPWSVGYSFSSTLATDFPDEPLMWLCAFIAVCFMALHHKKLLRANCVHPIILVLLLQLLWVLLAVFTSTYPLLSIKFLLAKSWYLLSFLALPVLFLDAQKLKTAALLLAISMLLFAVLALTRHASAGFSFATINESVLPFFRNHVDYSALLLCTIPVFFFALRGTASRVKKGLLGFVLLILLLALYFSYARGAWVGLITGGLAYGLLKKKALVASFFLCLLFCAGMVWWLQKDNRYLRYAPNFNKTIFHTDFREHLVATYQLEDMSTAERFYRWVAGVRMAKRGWKTGFGPSTFYNNYQGYTIPLFKTWVSRNEEKSTVHNYFLLLLVEQGVVGLLLFLLLLAIAFRSAQRLYHRTGNPFWKRALACVAVVLVMVCTVNFLSDLIETDNTGPVFYFCLAVLIVAERNIKRETSELAPHIQGIA
jgi:O-antigen ligase